MADYSDLRRDSLARASTVALQGVTLNTSQKTRIPGHEDMFPISLCLCVQDTPQNPCPCRELIVWIPEEALVRREESGRTSAAGENIVRFHLQRGAPILVESIKATAMRVESLEAQLARRSQYRKLRTMRSLTASRRPRGNSPYAPRFTIAEGIGLAADLIALYEFADSVGGGYQGPTGDEALEEIAQNLYGYDPGVPLFEDIDSIVGGR